MYYKVKTWIPVEAEDIEVYSDKGDAEVEAEELRSMQPENIYEAVACDYHGEDLN